MRTVALLFAVGLLTGCDQLKPNGPDSNKNPTGLVGPTGPSPQNREAYRVLCTQLSDSWSESRVKPPARSDSAQIAAAAHNAILDLEALKTDDPDLRRVRDEARAATEEAVASFRRLDQLPRPPESGELMLTGFVCGIAGRFDLAAEAGVRAKDRSDALTDEFRRLNAAYQRACAAKLLLKRATPKYAGAATIPGPIAVDLDEGFVLTADDWVTVTNTTGRALTSALVVVELTGANGDKKENVHFIPSLRSGATVFAEYPAGISAGGVVVGRQTVVLVQTVRVQIFAEEGVVGETVYQYAGMEKERDVARDMDVLRPGITGGFRNGLLGDKVFILTNSTGRSIPAVAVVTPAGTRQYGYMAAGDSFEVGALQVSRNLRSGDTVTLQIAGHPLGSWVTP